jgi:hypothetical protein
MNVDLALWLRSLGLEQYEAVFRDHRKAAFDPYAIADLRSDTNIIEVSTSAAAACRAADGFQHVGCRPLIRKRLVAALPPAVRFSFVG